MSFSLLKVLEVDEVVLEYAGGRVRICRFVGEDRFPLLDVQVKSAASESKAREAEPWLA